MPPQIPIGTALYDTLDSFEGGVNQGVSPLRLPKNVMARALNVTVRGDYATHRPPYQKRDILGPVDLIADAFKQGTFQGAAFYRPDDFAFESLMASIAGSLFQFQVNGNTITLTEQTGGMNQSVTAPQVWMWQSEKWLIWQDGVSNPVFWNGSDTPAPTIARSNYGTAQAFGTTTAASFVNPALGVAVTVNFTDTTNLVVGDIVTVTNFGNYLVSNVVGAAVTMVNQTGTFTNGSVPNLSVVTWQHTGTQLQPGRMGTYGMGRNVYALVDGQQFLFGDLVFGSSGTKAQNFRDSVLQETENSFIVGGGNFAVPGNNGDIKAMTFTANLDASLGQGPLQVFTFGSVFSCQVPVDRLTWQMVQNPILTESLIANGAQGQDSTQLANGDTIFRSVDGLRSLILARQDFGVWGNTPISFEVNDILNTDNPALLSYGSSVVFDNRYLTTCTPTAISQGVIHTGLIALNFDPLSSLRGKEPSVFDGLWTGLNIFKIIKGVFQNVERCFAFCWNTNLNQLELYELITSDSLQFADNNTTAIYWNLETSSLRFGQDGKTREYLRLNNGEFYIDELHGTLKYEVWYKPDQWPCWVLWSSGSVCQTQPVNGDQPGFSPRIGLGEPSPTPCDQTNNRPLREFYTCQFKFVFTGDAVFLGGRLKSITTPQPEFARMPECTSACP